MNEQKKGLKRNTIDKYYTKNDIVKICVNLIKQHLNIKKTDLIIEPSAGNGAFIDELKKFCKFCKFYDIEPEHKDILKQNFLELNYDELIKQNQQTHVIGNPPFGRQSSSAIKFIKKSCEFCDTLSFILPKSFKKESLKKIFPLNFHNICEFDIPEKAFLVNLEEHDVPCVFQIWIKKNINRIIPKKLQPKNFIFVRKEENPDISIRRVGVNAGNIDINIKNKSIQSHYFIKFNETQNIKKNIENLIKIKFDFNNTVGPKSISKQELMSKYNLVL